MGQTITKYIEYKSKDGVWGDNIELQAFRELYNIPIEIYVYSTTPLKTGLENNPNNA
jgi:OTU domain-containing protein 5